MATSIHPTAIVESGAQLGADCEIHAYAIITRHARLGDRVVVHPHAVIGGDPQFLKFDRNLSTYVQVGAGSVIREGVTLNRSIYADQATVVGENCFLMACSHLGHDCRIGNHVVLANNAMLAGHVTVGDFTFIGGGAGIHQFVRIGESAMVGGLSRLTRDVAPFLLVAERDEVSGLNMVGLKRRGVPRDSIRELKEAFRRVFSSRGNIREIAAGLLSDPQLGSAETRRFLEFFASGKRSFARPYRASGATSGEDSTE